MKKLFFLLFATVIGIGTMSAQGDSGMKDLIEVDGIWYKLVEEEGIVTAKVTFQGAYPGAIKEYSGKVVVPATVSYYDKTYNVVGIYDGAFAENDGLTAISLPESIKRIGWSSFEGCTGLTSIVVPNSVEYIGPEAFAGCTGLKSITFGTGLEEVNHQAFRDCSAVEIITCKATTPPRMIYAMGGDLTGEQGGEIILIPVFENVDYSQIPVYVPAASVPLYYRAGQWQDFKFIKAMDASTIVLNDDEAKATAAQNSVDIEWPAADGVIAYIIEIRRNTELICTMTFNAEGIILSAKYGAPARNGDNKALAATQTTNGWKYTIDGLEANSEYAYSVTAKKSDNTDAYKKSSTFTTKSTPAAIDKIVNGQSSNGKIIKNGQLYILRDGKTYTVTGAELK